MPDETYPRGSEWRKWDLHVHTPESYENNFANWDSYIKALKEVKDMAVIGITDYFFIDGYKRICEVKSKGNLDNFRLILPNIELRLGTFIPKRSDGSSLRRLNFHVIFSDTVPYQIIEEQFISALHFVIDGNPVFKPGERNLTRSAVEEAGALVKKNQSTYRDDTDFVAGCKTITVELDEVKKVLARDCFKDKYLLFLAAENWDQIDWAQDYLKRREFLQNAHGLFCGQKSTIDWCLGERTTEGKKEFIKEFGSLKPCIHGSDAHTEKDICKPQADKFCWIKANPTFVGLKQIINEPENRVYVGMEPPALFRKRSNQTKTLTGIAVKKTINSTLSEEWFDGVQIDLNSELVAIIGNKGGGKSALSDILGLLGNSTQQQCFSFLNPKKFRDGGKANNFEAKIIWADQTSSTCNLGNTDISGVETVKYIPQRYLEDICTELSSASFDNELEKVIFSHINREEQLGCATFLDLKEKRISAIKGSIGTLISELWEINKKIINIEEQLAPEYLQKIEKVLQEKKREYDAHVATKPQLDNPQDSSVNSPESDALQNGIDLKNIKLKEIGDKIEDVNTSIKNCAVLLAVAIRVKEKIENLEHTFKTLKETLEPELKSLGIEYQQVFSYHLSLTVITDKIETITAERIKLNNLLNASVPTSYVASRDQLVKEISELQAKLDAPQRKRQEYLAKLSIWEENRKRLKGDEETPDTIAFLEKRLSSQDSLNEEKKIAYELRINKVKEIYQKKQAIAARLTALYAPAQDVLANNHIAKENEFKMSFHVSITESGFTTDFLRFINKRKRGVFQGADDGKNILDSLLENAQYDSWEGALAFLQELLLKLAEKNPVVSQLLDPIKIYDFYNYIFGLTYLQPKYSLRWEGKELKTLSPGEKGNLLLIFFLLVDKDDRPLIIDQPEDNLDNQTIFRTLVPSINDAKKRRQIIMVTHNPNLAVVADADQIIYAHIEKENKNKVIYECGAIENPVMNKHILDVLEGTRPAFDSRDNKYQEKSTS